MNVKNIIVFCILVKFCQSQDFPSVTSRLGKIRGHYKISSNGNKYEAYEGIPYAMSPTGNRRFMPPEPIQPWQRRLKADKFRDVCIGHGREPERRINGDYLRGVEDCLYLNVYKAISKNNTSLPVIFWIYGGSFQIGLLTGTEQQSFMDQNVIFVSFNYRHGSLGFLSTEDEVVTGNMGLKDQAMALKWVSDNIECFGGDPKKITIAGLSAGGASVHYHYLSPMSKGLFRSGISFSGNALVPWAQAKNSREKAIKLGRLMNCSTHSMIQMIDCLRARPAESIVRAQAEFMPWHFNEFAPFGPVVEKHSKNPFIDRAPIDIINSGDANDVPWITGNVSEEGLFPLAEIATNDTAFEDVNENWVTIAPHLLHYYYTVPKRDHAAVAKKIRDHYFGDELISRQNFEKLIHLTGDRNFIVDAEKAARAQAKANKSPVYFYYYSYRASTSVSEFLSGSTDNFGVSHADDVSLAFGSFPLNISRTDFIMHEKLMHLWVSVIRYGVPTSEQKWSPFVKNNSVLNYLSIKKPDAIMEEINNNLGEIRFWQTINFDENKL